MPSVGSCTRSKNEYKDCGRVTSPLLNEGEVGGGKSSYEKIGAGSRVRAPLLVGNRISVVQQRKQRPGIALVEIANGKVPEAGG